MLNLPNIVPGLYAGAGKAALLRSDDQQWLLQNQFMSAGGGTSVNTTAAGGNPYASVGVLMERIRAMSYPSGFSLHVYFTNSLGAALSPGAFEVDLQTSDIDSDANYCTFQSLTSLNPSNVGRIEVTTLWARYARAFVKTITVPCYVNILASR